MQCTTEKVELLDQTTELAKMIIQSETVEHYLDCYYKLQNNQQAQAKINSFVRLKEAYDEVQRFGTYHPDYKTVMKEIRNVKREMDLDDAVANFKKAETALQALLDEVSVIIGHAVSKHIKVPTGNPFFEQLSACSGGCASGSGCGC